MHDTGPFSIPAIRSFVPERLKPWILILFVIVFQLSGGVYMAAVAEMEGSTALMHEDIMMAGYASLVGLAVSFVVQLRLKFRFPLKTTLLLCATVIILCNMVCMHSISVPVLVVVSFVAGFFRMWGTFACNSTIQLWITPKRDLSVFFCYVYLLVHSMIQFTGVSVAAMAWWQSWEYIHLLCIGLLLALMIATVILFRSFHFMKPLPLYGVDWLGGVMWSIVALLIIFICVYGDHYDWFESPYIRIAAVAVFVVGGLNYWRSTFIRHPYIDPQTWRYPVLRQTIAIYFVFELFIAPEHLLDHAYFGGILGYDALHSTSLNWATMAGTAVGALFTWRVFAIRKWGYKRMTTIAFGVMVAYVLYNYFTIDYNLPKESLVLPLFLRGFGYAVFAITFLTALTRIPFQHFFQGVTLQNFVSASLGGAVATAALGELLKRLMHRNAMLLGSTLDSVNPAAVHSPLGTLYGAVQQQALMLSMKEIYGWLAIVGIGCIGLFMIHESDIPLRPDRTIYPTWRAVRNLLKRRYGVKPLADDN